MDSACPRQHFPTAASPPSAPLRCASLLQLILYALFKQVWRRERWPVFGGGDSSFSAVGRQQMPAGRPGASLPPPHEWAGQRGSPGSQQQAARNSFRRVKPCMGARSRCGLPGLPRQPQPSPPCFGQGTVGDVNTSRPGMLDFKVWPQSSSALSLSPWLSQKLEAHGARAAQGQQRPPSAASLQPACACTASFCPPTALALPAPLSAGQGQVGRVGEAEGLLLCPLCGWVRVGLERGAAAPGRLQLKSCSFSLTRLARRLASRLCSGVPLAARL